MTTSNDKVFDAPKGADPYGVGMSTDGSVAVMSPEAYKQAVLDRNAYENESAEEDVEGAMTDEEIASIAAELEEDDADEVAD